MNPFTALRWLSRPTLLVAWALVAWGHLLGLLTLWNAVSRGWRPAMRLLAPLDGSFWAWLNAAAVLSAALAWMSVIVVSLTPRPDDEDTGN